jgi:DNA polymerase III epsilon subunit-like protein
MIHLNGHLMCAIDTETSGLKPYHHDIIQISVIPLNYEYSPNQRYMPFMMDMAPSRPENVDMDALTINKKDYVKIINDGIAPHVACDLFYDWFDKLLLPEGKRIIPVASNWYFDSQFIIDWLGYETFNLIFDGRPRDLMVAAAFINDRAVDMACQIPFPQLTIKKICNSLNIPHSDGTLHDATTDALLTAECYKRLLRMNLS